MASASFEVLRVSVGFESILLHLMLQCYMFNHVFVIGIHGMTYYDVGPICKDKLSIASSMCAD